MVGRELEMGVPGPRPAPMSHCSPIFMPALIHLPTIVCICPPSFALAHICLESLAFIWTHPLSFTLACVCLDLPAFIQTCSPLFGLTHFCLDSPACVWTCPLLFTLACIHLDLTAFVWTHLPLFGLPCLCLVSPTFVRTCLHSSGLTCLHLDSLTFVWTCVMGLTYRLRNPSYRFEIHFLIRESESEMYIHASPHPVAIIILLQTLPVRER